MFEINSYGFTDGKFHLPTLAVYMSYLRQLVVNMSCRVQNEKNNGNDVINLESTGLCHDIDGSISDQWWFFLKEGKYVIYFQRKVTAIPFNWTFINKQDSILTDVQEKKRKELHREYQKMCRTLEASKSINEGSKNI